MHDNGTLYYIFYTKPSILPNTLALDDAEKMMTVYVGPHPTVGQNHGAQYLKGARTKVRVDKVRVDKSPTKITRTTGSHVAACVPRKSSKG